MKLSFAAAMAALLCQAWLAAGIEAASLAPLGDLDAKFDCRLDIRNASRAAQCAQQLNQCAQSCSYESGPGSINCLKNCNKQHARCLRG